MGLIEVHIWICPPQASTSTLYTTEWPGGCFTVYRNPLGIKAIMTKPRHDSVPTHEFELYHILMLSTQGLELA